MRSRILVGTLATIIGLSVGLVAVTRAADSVVKSAAINLVDTTSIAGALVSGPVMFIHDDAKMARGEPCTGVYRFEPGRGPAEEIVSFHCKPRWGRAPQRFTKTLVRDATTGMPVLTEYQFAGDAEAHGVPTRSR
jgi:hypothetical protein